MKKMMHMIFSFSLSFLIFASNICLAARPICLADEPRPMTEQESVQFTSKIKTYFSDNFIARIGLTNFFKDCFWKDRKANKFDLGKIAEFIGSFETNNDQFDIENKLLIITFSLITPQGCITINPNPKPEKLKSFGEAITLYHTHISNSAEFLKQPLCCRALSAYILYKLIEMGIECKYVKCTVFGNKEDHDVVAYKVEGKWYVCDLMFALISGILRNCCNNPESIEFKQEFPLEKTEPAYLLKMPMDEYKKSMRPGNTWDETNLTLEILDLDWKIVSDHNNKFSNLKEILEAKQKQ